MKNKKIINVITFLLAICVILNTVIAFVSYKEVCDGKKPTISFGTSKKDGEVVYNELLYNVKEDTNDKTRTVSLKLFFLK